MKHGGKRSIGKAFEGVDSIRFSSIRVRRGKEKGEIYISARVRKATRRTYQSRI
jgi:hypothetical protein